MMGLLRHRQTKGPDSARPYLNRRATPRLHLKTRHSYLSSPAALSCSIALQAGDDAVARLRQGAQQGAIRDYVAMANLFAFSSHLGAFKPITRSHRNTDPSTRKAEAIT
jgi:hypothetical protein